ncbi:MAG: hypothetical protein R3F44_08660 [Candidatus Competibacteraceae bacterium]
MRVQRTALQPALVETIIAGVLPAVACSTRWARNWVASPDAYFQLLQGLATSLRACLSGV